MPAAFDAYFETMDESLLAVMGEECTYAPKDGDTRTVTAAIEEEANFAEGQNRLESRSRLHALVMRDPEHADYGGIATPQPGETLTREGEEIAYSYSGVKREVSTSAWVLEFQRDLPHELGGYRR